MLPGYNHNVQYKNRIFHIQTEDSGVNNPHIITLLYEKGNILSRKKTGYADILKTEKLNQVVKEMMQEQHKSMLKDLKNGTFDKIIAAGAILPPAPEEVQAQAVAAQKPAAPAAAAQPGAGPAPAEEIAAIPPPQMDGKIIELRENEELKDEDIFGADLISDKSLDEVILNYLSQNLDEE